MVQFLLHTPQGLRLGLLGNLPFESLIFDAVLEHVDFVLVEGFDGINHLLLLSFLNLLTDGVLLLLFQQLVLFQFAS